MQPAACHVVQRDSSAIKFHIIEIAFILATFNWLKSLSDDVYCDWVRHFEVQFLLSVWQHVKLSEYIRP